MPVPENSMFLRRVLLADAVTGIAAGLLMWFGADVLHEPLGVPAALLRYAGMGLLPLAALIIYVATRDSMPRAGVWFIIMCNAVWAADSILLLFSGWIEPTRLGQAFVVAQAVVVALFAELEFFGLRKFRAVAA